MKRSNKAHTIAVLLALCAVLAQTATQAAAALKEKLLPAQLKTDLLLRGKKLSR